MKKMLMVAVAGVFVAGCSAVDVPRPDVEVLRAEFGLYETRASGGIVFVPTTRVPLVADQPYGYRIFVKTDKAKVLWREEFELPQAPQTWGAGERAGLSKISSDRKTSVTEGELDVSGGVIAHSWTVAPGDPTGKYVMRVFVEGRLIKTFEFRVE